MAIFWLRPSTMEDQAVAPDSSASPTNMQNLRNRTFVIDFTPSGSFYGVSIIAFRRSSICIERFLRQPIARINAANYDEGNESSRDI
jgi:hypothetical protein